MTIKQILTEANRYDDVMDFLQKTANIKLSSCPVDPYNKGNGHITYYVNGKQVSEGAAEMISMIDSGLSRFSFVDKFIPLYQYIKTCANNILHNYAIAATHRIMVSDVNIDTARIWLIIQNMMDASNIPDVEWSIPIGWKKVIK